MHAVYRIEEGLSTMIVRELEKRDQVRRSDVGIGEILDSADKAEDQYMCFKCKAFCYLSQVICSCTRQVACLDHGPELCNCDSASRTLRKRFSESQLVDIQRAVSERASIPQTWRTRFETTLAESARPSVKALRALVAEGEKIAHPMPELSTLRGFVAQINSWMVRAGALLNRKKASGRKRARKARDSDDDYLMDVDDDPLGEISKKPAEEVIKQLLLTAEKMAFDTPEILQLRHLVQSIGVFRRHASALLNTSEQDMDMKACEKMYMTGDALNVDTPELHQLDLILRRKEWLDTMNNLDEEFLALSDVENYLEQAEDCEIPVDHEFVRYLKFKLSKGTAWRRRAEIVIAACLEPENNERNITLDELMALTNYDDDVPVNEKLASKLGDLLRKTEGVIQSCKLILNPGSEEERKSMAHIRKMLKTADTKAPGVIIPELEMVEAIVTQQDEWLKRVGKLVGETRQPGLGIEKLLQQTRQLLDPLDDHYPADHNGIMEQDGVSVAVSRFNCVCRQPAKAKMYQCRKCLELYHLGCIPSTYVEELNGRVIKCPFCRTKDQTGQKPQPRPSLLKFMPLLDTDAWKLGYEFEELTQIRDLVALCKHIGDLVLTPVDSDPVRCEIKTEDTRFLRHWLRKLRDLPINIEIETQPQSVSLYPALLSRLKQVRRARVQALIKPGEGPGLSVPGANRRPSASTAGPGQRRTSTNFPAGEIALKITQRPTGKDALEVARRRHRWPWMFFERWPKPEGEAACLCGGPDWERPMSWHSRGIVKCSMCEDDFHHDCAAVEWWRLDDDHHRIEEWMCPFCSANFSRSYDGQYIVTTHGEDVRAGFSSTALRLHLLCRFAIRTQAQE
jgi:histone demethylase JARID1